MDVTGNDGCNEYKENDRTENLSAINSCISEREDCDQFGEVRQVANDRSEPSKNYRRSGINNCNVGNQSRRSLKSLLLSCQKNRNDSFDYSTESAKTEEEAEPCVDGKMALKRSSSVPNRVLLPLHEAVKNNDVKEISKLFKKKRRIDIDIKDEDGFSPLHRAAQLGNTEAVQVLLSHGANVNLPSKANLKPLYYAVQSGNFECASLLIENGADQSDIKDGFTDSKQQDAKIQQRFTRTRMSLHS